MLFGILAIRILADLTRTFSARQTLNPPYVLYMFDYLLKQLPVCDLYFFLYVLCFYKICQCLGTRKISVERTSIQFLRNLLIADQSQQILKGTPCFRWLIFLSSWFSGLPCRSLLKRSEPVQRIISFFEILSKVLCFKFKNCLE